MTDPEFMKEYLRKAFMEGHLDVSGSREAIEGFVRMFAGEMESIIAVQQANYLGPEEQDRLMRIAAPNEESADHYKSWMADALGKRSRRAKP